MAVDKAIDSAKLNATLAYEANRIRAKTGDSDDLAFDFANEKGFGDAIDAIPTGGGLELLADDTAAEDVATINLVIPQGKQSLPAYFVVLNGETSANEWIYPQLNSTSPSQGQGAYFSQTRIYDNTCFVVAQHEYGGNRYVLPTGTPMRVNASAISNILLSLYAASSTFKSGFNVKVYGVSI